MSVKPILFNTDMVRAILDGRKTVTRRVITPQPEMALAYIMAGHNYGKWQYSVFEEEEYKKHQNKNLYWTPPCNGDDILYVRETWSRNEYGTGFPWLYKASPEYNDFEPYTWKPSIHMPKEAARIWLKVTNVRVERLQDITTDQIITEGVKTEEPFSLNGAEKRYAFSQLWDSTIKKENINRYSWEGNPWVWVIEFERCGKPQEVEQ